MDFSAFSSFEVSTEIPAYLKPKQKNSHPTQIKEKHYEESRY